MQQFGLATPQRSLIMFDQGAGRHAATIHTTRMSIESCSNRCRRNAKLPSHTASSWTSLLHRSLALMTQRTWPQFWLAHTWLFSQIMVSTGAWHWLRRVMLSLLHGQRIMWRTCLPKAKGLSSKISSATQMGILFQAHSTKMRCGLKSFFVVCSMVKLCQGRWPFVVGPFSAESLVTFNKLLGWFLNVNLPWKSNRKSSTRPSNDYGGHHLPNSSTWIHPLSRSFGPLRLRLHLLQFACAWTDDGWNVWGEPLKLGSSLCAD